MSNPSFRIVAQYAETIGTEAAIRLAGFFGGTGANVGVPTTDENESHVLCRLLGKEAFSRLVAHYGGQTIRIPALNIAPLRRAGMVWLMTRNNMSTRAQSHLLQVTPEHCRRIAAELKREGYFDLADNLESEGDFDVC